MINTPKFCISLAKRADRWERAQAHFNRIGINVMRWIAVDGSELDIPRDSLKKEEFNAKGILGCMTSHYELIEHAKQKKFPAVMVFEDDVFLCDDFQERLKYIDNVKFDLFYLGGHWERFGRGAVPTNHKYIYNCKEVSGTYAYIMRDTLYDYVLENMDYNWGADQFFAAKIQSQFDCKCMIPLMADHLNGQSDVAGRPVTYRQTKRFFKRDMKKAYLK